MLLFLFDFRQFVNLKVRHPGHQNHPNHAIHPKNPIHPNCTQTTQTTSTSPTILTTRTNQTTQTTLAYQFNTSSKPVECQFYQVPFYRGWSFLNKVLLFASRVAAWSGNGLYCSYLGTFSFLFCFIIFRASKIFIIFSIFIIFQVFRISMFSRFLDCFENTNTTFIGFSCFCSSSFSFTSGPRITWLRLVLCKTWFYLF